jgi:hypothetical protein
MCLIFYSVWVIIFLFVDNWYWAIPQANLNYIVIYTNLINSFEILVEY